MKLRYLWTVFSLLFTFASALAVAPRDEQWRTVDQAVAEGLPQTAIEQLNPIIAGALADKAYPEAIKAIGRKIVLEGSIQGNKPEEQIARMNAALATAPEEMRPMLEAIVARWYWHYFQQNRWRFMQRTQTGAAPGPDFDTWDLARILAEIDVHFTAALAGEEFLKSTPIASYDGLLPAGSVPDAYRPTLYDFLAHEALEFYRTGEHGATKAEDAFEIDADSPIFSDAEEFSRWQPESTDQTSPALKAIRIYQNLLKFHRTDRDRSAYHDVDLARLTYGHNIAVGDNKDQRFKSALERFIAATAKHEISARALAALATQLNEEGDPVRAHELARRGFKAFPETAGGAMCYNLIQQIEAKSAQISTEQVWNAPWPTLDVTYRNLTRVYFRAVAVDFEDYLSKSRWSYGQIDDDVLRKMLASPAALAWQSDLPATHDFKSRTQSVPAPATLKPGFYFILASHDAAFGKEENQIAMTPVWVSELALITHQSSDTSSLGGFVLRANSGEPVGGASVQVWQRNKEGWMKLFERVKTDEHGRFTYVTRNANLALVLLAEQGGQAIATPGEVHHYGRGAREQTRGQTVFFTDRSLYRPGQIVSYKGICFRGDRTGATYETLARQRVSVVFSDANGKEIARATHTSNDYGSFSGSFTNPRDGVTGRMTLRVDGNPVGQASFRVEEYKRPKFQVELQPPAEAAKLDAPAQLSGKATAYTGAAIGGAKVKWRVERNVQFPRWCWWWQPPEAKAIAHGTAATGPDGAFKVEFTAQPDRAIPVKTEPVFVYTIHADVTDSTGETRSSSRTIRAGYAALQAAVEADEWQTSAQPVKLTISTSSLNDDPQAAQGTVTIHALQQPATVQRAALGSSYRHRGFGFRSLPEPEPDPTLPDSWDLGQVAAKLDFKTDAKGTTEVAAKLAPGIYRVSVETKDRFGKKVTARHTAQVVDPQAKHFAVKVPNHVAAPKWSVEPGEKFSALWGSGYVTARAFVELEYAGKPLRSYWTAADRTQELIELPVTEAMRGGVTLRITSVRENRAYINQRVIDVPWTNKLLTVKWESFRSKLLPGQQETWTAVVTGPDAQRASAEMVAALYDASLDQFSPHSWVSGFGGFRRESPRNSLQFHNNLAGFNHLGGDWQVESREVAWRYRAFPDAIRKNRGGWDFAGNDQVLELSPFAVNAPASAGYAASQTLAGSRMRTELNDMASTAVGGNVAESNGYNAATKTAAAPGPDLNQVTARKNLSETAFFFPHLHTDPDGRVRMEFTMPEALTQWKFLAFAHDRKLRAGLLTDTVVTSKDIMVQPNPPRFLREGDELEFTVKVSNQTDQPQSGSVRLTFNDAASLAPADAALRNAAPEQKFEIPAKQSRSYSWRIAVPEGAGVLTYKAVGATSQASDGEEGFLPVLSRRVLVTESLPLPIRGAGTRAFDFDKLLASGGSSTLRSQSLTVQMVSQPAWYAVLALPYLMEFPYECSEQVFNRLYANALSRHIVRSNPKIGRVFEQWRNTPALDSPLQKNEELKSVLLEETPWVREAASESQGRRNVGLLFEDNRLDHETARALQQLSDQQLANGLWPWFAGGRPSEYISLYIMTGFGRLRHLGAAVDVAPAIKSLQALDDWMSERHRQILTRPYPDAHVPDSLEALYLYGRSFFLADHPITEENRVAVDFFLQQARRFWLKLNSRQSQAHLALALQRFGDKTTPAAIMRSIKERSVSDPELGMFWRDQELNWWWYHAPIETQAAMIEAFDEVAHDAAAVEACQTWLLKQKQTQDWKTTKATADAVYALLLGGSDLLASDALVEVSLGGQAIKPAKVEAGTGFYEKKFIRGEITPNMGHIKVKKTDAGVSWGSVHWQYLEDMTKITPHAGTPLKLSKSLFVKETTAKGPVLKPVTGPVSVGDELVVRIELRTDRDMEYVHLKDQRGSGTEPVNVLSGYRYQDGLAYYESTRDTASHFFIDYLPKGTYVFEYSTRIQLRGRYQSGIAEIQCMYASEFNSHSGSLELHVK